MTLTPEEREERGPGVTRVANVATHSNTSNISTATAHDTIAPEEVLESERGSLVTGMVIARAWRDPEFRERLRNAPEQVLKAAGLNLPGNVKVRVFEDTPAIKHIALTSLTTEPDELLPLVREGGQLSELLPLREGSEVRLIQNTEQALCLVVPLAPAEPELLTDVDVLRRLAPRAAAFAGGDVVQSMAEAFAASEAALEGAAEVATSTFGQAADVVQSAASTFVQSEAALLGAAEASTASAAQSAAAAQASAAAATSVSTNTNQVTNVNVYTQTEVDVVAQAEAAVTAVEAQTAVTTTTVAAEAEAAAVAVAVAAVVLT